MRRFLFLFVLAAAVLRPAAKGKAAEADGPVNLPPFIVEEASKGPPWRYAEMPGFEILSRCNDRTTRDLALAHYRLHRLLELLLPPRLQLTFTVPKAIIFYDEDLQPAASREVITSMLQRAAKDDVRSEMPAFPGGRFGGREAPGRRVSFLPNLRLWDNDAMTVFTIIRNGGYDSDRLVLTRDYVNYLLLHRTPALPWWFVTGVLALYDRVEYSSSSLNLAPIVWISEPVTDALQRDPKTAPAPLPLGEFFASVPLPTTPDGEARRKVWDAQCALFVRWALDGQTPERREAFWDLVEQVVKTGMTAAAFQNTLGLDFAAADAKLAAYLPIAVRKTATLRPAQPFKPPVLALRDASAGELARIKGDWERLEVGFVRLRFPELADKYLEQARRTLRHAYDRDVRDPALLAALGLCECDAGDDRAAREFLEAAARLGPVRPRAGYELARLRFAAAIAAPAGAGGQLDAAQVAGIFTPLFAAREQRPHLPEVYDLIAQVWASAAYRPTRGHLDVLEDGVRLFPRRGTLIYRAAALYAENGYLDEAAKLVSLGLMVATNADERDRFAQLEARLPVPAAPAPN